MAATAAKTFDALAPSAPALLPDDRELRGSWLWPAVAHDPTFRGAAVPHRVPAHLRGAFRWSALHTRVARAGHDARHYEDPMLLAHRVVAPRAPSDRAPLLVLLHGIGADESDLLPLAQYFDPRFTVVSARAPYEAEPTGYRWYSIDWAVRPPRGDRVEIVASRDLLARFVEEATGAYGTDPSLVFLFGFSQGAVMSLALLLARPDLVHGVIAHSGQLARLPGPDPTPEALSRAEALLLHGAQDDVIPAAQGYKAYEVLAPLLGARVAYRAFEALGHGISEDSVVEAARWLTTRLDDGPKESIAGSVPRSRAPR